MNFLRKDFINQVNDKFDVLNEDSELRLISEDSGDGTYEKMTTVGPLEELPMKTIERLEGLKGVEKSRDDVMDDKALEDYVDKMCDEEGID